MIGHPLVFREEVDSTNSLARTLAEQGAAHGTAVWARRQTSGRGRRGRSWLPLSGDPLYLSVVLRPKLAAERLPEITFVAAVAVSEALDRIGVRAQIKWPNDLEVNGLKLAGILSELAVDGSGRVQFVVLGIGVNVNAVDFPDEIRDRATSLRLVTGSKQSTEAILTAVLESLEHWLKRHEAEGLTPVLREWRMRTSTLGTQVRVTLDGLAVEGAAEDIDETGALLVRVASGQRHRIIAGEVVTLRRQA